MEPQSTLESAKMAFQMEFRRILRPKDQSDRTTLAKITKWLGEQCKAGRFDEDIIFERVLEMAREMEAGAKARTIRNPWAVFLSVVKKELGYVPGKRFCE